MPASPERGSTAPVAITVDVADPRLGPLTFDALAAGDPGAAREGRLVLLLHGFPETAASYRAELAPLATAGYYAVAVDQRGYSPGARPTEVDAYRVDALVGDVVAIADALGADRFHLVGHDWGGGVAWATAAAHPDRVADLLVLSTPHPDALGPAIADPADPQHAASAYMATFRAPGAEDRMLADGPAGLVRLFGPGAGGLPADAVAEYAETLGTPGALGAALNWYRANPLPFPEALGTVEVPTTYLWGSADGAFTRGTAESTAAFVRGPFRFVELPGRSHWLPEEAPDDVVDAALALFDGTLPVRAGSAGR